MVQEFEDRNEKRLPDNLRGNPQAKSRPAENTTRQKMVKEEPKSIAKTGNPRKLVKKGDKSVDKNGKNNGPE
jgi:hypothetical protein